MRTPLSSEVMNVEAAMSRSAKRSSRRAFALAVLAAILAASCSPFLGRSAAAGKGHSTISVQLKGLGRAAGRNALPDPVLPGDLVYDLSITQSSGSLSQSGLASGALSLSGVETGTWTLTVTGRSGTSALFGASTPVTIVAGPNSFTIQLEPLTASTGDAAIDLSWPASLAASALVYWSNDLAAVESRSPSILYGGVTSDFALGTMHIAINSVPSGIYYLAVDFRNSALARVCTAIETVEIYDHQTSKDAIPLGVNDFSKQPAAPSSPVLVEDASNNITGFFWTDNADTETEFIIYENGAPLVHVPANSGSWARATPIADAGSYTISAHNDFGDSTPLPFAKGQSLTVPFAATYSGFSFESLPPSITSSQAFTFIPMAAHADPAPFSGWAWYVDGIRQPVYDGMDSFLFNGSGKAPGDYIVTVSALKYQVLYSGAAKISVASRPYGVSYSMGSAESGNPPIDPATYSSGDVLTLLANDGSLQKGNWSFVGWTENPAGMGAVFKPGDSYVMGGADVVFYPKWFWLGSNLIAITGTGQICASAGPDALAWSTSSPGSGSLVWGQLAGSFDKTTLFAAAGNFTDASEIWKSVDHGKNWATTTAVSAHYDGLAVSANGQIVGATVYDGTNTFYYSTNGGSTWNTTTISDLAIPATGVWWGPVACSSDGMTWLTVNSGDGATNVYPWIGHFDGVSAWTWTRVDAINPGTIISGDYDRANSVGVSANGQKMVVSTQTKVFVSIDGGTSWTQTDPGATLSANAPNYVQYQAATISTDGSTIAVTVNASNSLYISRNDGATWTTSTIGTALTIGPASLSNDGTRILVPIQYDLTNYPSDSGYLYYSKDGGTTFNRADSTAGQRSWARAYVQG
jgi:hypothetical protein